MTPKQQAAWKAMMEALRPLASIGKQISKTDYIEGSRRVAVRAVHLRRAAKAYNLTKDCKDE